MDNKSRVFEIIIEDTQEKFKGTHQQTVLNAMLALGRKGIPSGCHGGGCGVCRIKVLDGEYEHKKLSRQHVSEIEEKEGYVLACRMFPKSDIRLKTAGKLKKALFKNYLGHND